MDVILPPSGGPQSTWRAFTPPSTGVATPVLVRIGGREQQNREDQMAQTVDDGRTGGTVPPRIVGTR